MSFSMDKVAEHVNKFSLIFWEKQPEVPWDFQAGVFSDILKWDMAEQVVPSKSKK